MPILRYTELIELIYLTSIMKEERVKSQKISTDDLLEYYWNNEPIYHPEVVKPMAPNSVKKNRILSFVLLILYISFTVYLLQISTNPHIISWIFGLICGAFVADFISGCAHIFIDFMPSTKKTSLHTNSSFYQECITMSFFARHAWIYHLCGFLQLYMLFFWL